MDVEVLKARFPGSLMARVQSLSGREGTVTVVLDASDLDAAGRADLEKNVRDVLGAAEEVTEVRVAMTADRKQRVMIAIGSGKGGVGKSTLTANLAVALARMGRKVGVVDADVYGPSQPTLLATKGDKPEARDDKLVPVQSPHGVTLLSMGHLVEPGKALAWRGPMAGNAMAQLVDAHWDDIEILLIDLPPGTGDVQLTMLQRFKPSGAVIVSTPQDLALIDAQRAANLFDSGKVEIIGLVENMAGYACPHCGEISDPFGKGGVEAAAQGTGIPFLGRIPLALEVRAQSDAGAPPALGDGAEAEPFRTIAGKLLDWLDGAGG